MIPSSMLSTRPPSEEIKIGLAAGAGEADERVDRVMMAKRANSCIFLLGMRGLKRIG
jgi:hypothetical protein